MKNFNIVLFNNFETLDVFGPVEVIGRLDKFYEINYYSLNGGIIKSSQNVRIETLPISTTENGGVVLIPGGFGAREEVNNPEFLNVIKKLCSEAEYVLTVCTGSALVAKAGLLSGMSATSNKRSFDWASEQDKSVNWIRKARWTNDGKYYTSSGISAGIDMTLGFVADRFSFDTAKLIANSIEYIWNMDKDYDPFCVISESNL